MKFTISLITFILLCLIALPAAAQESTQKIMWVQVGNQIKDLSDSDLDMLQNCGFTKIALLHSSINDQGYFPKLSSIVKRAHDRGIKVAVGTLVFKDTFQKKYWMRHPELRHCDRSGNYTEHKYYHYQICPNNPLNHEYIASLMVGKASSYNADEVHIDYEISPCYCKYCREKFHADTGKDLLQLEPTDRTVMEWRSRNTRDFFALLARKARTADLPLRISATAPIIAYGGGFTAYGTDLRYEDLTIYADEFEPMIYLSNKQKPELAGDRYLKIARRVIGRPVIPGIILNEEFTPNIKSGERIASELKSLKDSGADGIALFEIRYLNEELQQLFKGDKI